MIRQLFIRSRFGQSIIELQLVIGLSAILLPALVAGFVATREGVPQENQRLLAVGLLREAEEAIRSSRDKDWNNISTNGTFHPVIAADNSWQLVAGSETTVNQFTRYVVISDVFRDSNGDIVSSGGTLDPSTKHVTTTVGWSTPYASSVTSENYLHRFTNNAYIQTTAVDFNNGTNSGTTVTNSSGGEVSLGAGGGSDWCSPNLSINAVDLPKNGVANAISAIEGKIFAGTGDNSSGVSYATVNVSNTNPPVGTVASTFNGYKTNDTFGETNYAYLATDNNSKEIVIVSIGAVPYTEAGYFNSPGNGDGNSVYVAGNYGYMTSGNQFYIFDLASKNGSRSQIGTGVTLAGTGTKIVINGDYAYVSISDSGVEMQIIDISNPNAPTVVGQADVNGQAAVDLYINQSATRAYLATSVSDSQSEFFIIDIAVKSGNRPTLGAYEANGMSPKGVSLATNNKAILGGTGAEEYQAIDISNEASPTRCGGLNIDSGVNGVATVLESDGDAFSYIITGDSTTELKIIGGGPGGGYASGGTFTSSPFNVGRSAVFNRFDVSFSKPNQTDIQFQVAVADPVSDSCTSADYVFVGPDGTSGTYFSDDSTIIFNDDGTGFENPAQCFKYKVLLSTSDQSSTPTLYDFTVNYSP